MSNFQKVLEYSAKWLEIIRQDSVTIRDGFFRKNSEPPNFRFR